MATSANNDGSSPPPLVPSGSQSTATAAATPPATRGSSLSLMTLDAIVREAGLLTPSTKSDNVLLQNIISQANEGLNYAVSVDTFVDYSW